MLKGIDRGAATAPKQILEALQEYAVECSILKVMGTETLDFMADEAVQIFGGYGFCSGYDVERAYRDQRVNRIFEGTNEINRLLITDMLMKRSLKGQLPLLAAAQKLTDEILGMAPLEETDDDAPLAEEARLVQGAKKVLLLVAGSAVQRYMLALEHEQEVIGVISNLVMAVYAMESVLLRTQKKLAKASHRQPASPELPRRARTSTRRPIAWRWKHGGRWRASRKATRSAPISPSCGDSCGVRRPIRLA